MLKKKKQSRERSKAITDREHSMAEFNTVEGDREL